MQFEIEKQSIVIEGKVYSASTIEQRYQESREKGDTPLREVVSFLRDWFSSSYDTMEVQTSGSTGTPKKMQVAKQKMLQSACTTCHYLGLSSADTALLCMNMKYIGAKMMVVRALLLGMKLVVREASGHPLQDITEEISFAAMVPLQVYNSLQNGLERERLKSIRKVIIGGGALDASMEKELSSFPNLMYATYGMTETLSHIALRALSGPAASRFFTPVEGVTLSLSEKQCLCIEAPLICEAPIQTNDIVRLYTDGSFVILGRIDNIINSGGIKIVVEEVESILLGYVAAPLAITSVPDRALGQAVVLLHESSLEEEAIVKICQEYLSPYKRPKRIFRTHLPLTPNGKIDRKELQKVALQLIRITSLSID